MKENYITPEMDITHFECEDIITASGIVASSEINELRFLPARYIDSIDTEQWS